MEDYLLCIKIGNIFQILGAEVSSIIRLSSHILI